MNPRKIVMPVQTVADWGGVHEWTVDAAECLLSAGHEVIFVGSGELFEQRVKEVGAKFHRIDWKDSIEEICNQIPLETADLIFSHAPRARLFGISLAKRFGCEHIVMIHGAFHDRMYEWSDQVNAFAAASPSLVHYVQRYGRVAPWKVSCIPNAAKDEYFDIPFNPVNQKIDEGEARVVLASRLSTDKLSQLNAAEEAISYLAKSMSSLRWKLDIYGDGPLRSYYESRLKRMEQSNSNVFGELKGWIPPAEVPVRMNNAFLTVTAGMAGMRACASGSACLAVGARSYVGVQYSQNLRAGLWSNFGDHGVQNFIPTPLHSDLDTLLDFAAHDQLVQETRSTVRLSNSQKVVDGIMRSVLQC